MKTLSQPSLLFSTLCAGMALGMSLTVAITTNQIVEQKASLEEPAQPLQTMVADSKQKPTMWDTPKTITPVFDDGKLVIYEEPQNTLELYRDDNEQLALTYETGNEAINIARKGGSIVTTSAPVVFTNL